MPHSQPGFDSPISRLRGLPHAPQSQPCFFTTTSLLESSYSPAVTLFFFLVSFCFSTVMVLVLRLLLPAAAAAYNISTEALFFCDFSAARPRFVARLARSDNPQSRRPCPRADPPSPRPSRSASQVARSRLRGLPHAPQSQPSFFTRTSLLGSSYSPAVTLFFFVSFWFSTVMV